MTISQHKLSHYLSPLIVVGLFFSVTNKVYLSALPSVVVLLIILALCALTLFQYLRIKEQRVVSHNAFLDIYEQPISLATASFYFIALVSVLIYHPSSLFEFGFYRYDGNFIVSYALFLFLPWFVFQGDIEQLFKRFILFACIIQLPFFIEFLLNDYPYFHTLFAATNAAGGFFTIVLAMAISHFFYRREKHMLIWIVLLAIMLFFTTSRGSMLGILAGVIAWYGFKQNKFKWLPLGMIALVILVQAFLLFKYYPLYAQKVHYEDYPEHVGMQDFRNKKHENIYNRLLNSWPKSWDYFTQSPLLGKGVGSINDEQKIAPQENPMTAYQFNSAHGHHSYLHVLAEQGVLGLAVLIWMWYQILKFLKENQQIPWISQGLSIAFWTLIFTSFTEHRITTPAMLLPFSLLFLCYFGWIRQQKLQS